MAFSREIKVLLTQKNLLLIKKKINEDGELRYFIPTIPLGLSDQPVRVLHAKFFNIYHQVEMSLKSFFGKKTFRSKSTHNKSYEVFPYHINITNSKNLELIYDFLKTYNTGQFSFLNFRWFDLASKDLRLFQEEDQKIIEELSCRVIYGEEALKNPFIKKLILKNKKEPLSRELS